MLLPLVLVLHLAEPQEVILQLLLLLFHLVVVVVVMVVPQIILHLVRLAVRVVEHLLLGMLVLGQLPTHTVVLVLQIKVMQAVTVMVLGTAVAVAQVAQALLAE